MNPLEQPRRTVAAPEEDLVATHGAAKQAEAADPLDLVGRRVPGGDIDVLARCFIEEFAAMGYGCDQILELFRQPQYIALHPAYRAKGEAAIRDLIQEVLADCGVFRVSGPVPDEPSDPCPEFVQIELPRPDNEDN